MYVGVWRACVFPFIIVFALSPKPVHNAILLLFCRPSAAVHELLPGILSQLGPESMQELRKVAEKLKSMDGGAVRLAPLARPPS